MRTSTPLETVAPSSLGDVTAPGVAALIDIGSASAVVQVVASNPTSIRDDPRGGIIELARDKVSLRLGAALINGRFDDATVERVVATLCRFAALARRNGVDPASSAMVAVATEAMRRAENAPALCAAIARESGITLRVIDGTTEAALAFMAARMRCPAGMLVSVDIGGGSTEVAWGQGAQPDVAVSVSAGAVVLCGRYGLSGVVDAPTLDAARADVDALLAGGGLPRHPPALMSAGTVVLGTSGSIQRVAKLLCARQGNDPDAVDGRIIAADDLKWVIDTLASRDLAARKDLAGMDVERADVLLAGAVIIERVAYWLGHDEWRVATTGLRTALAAVALGIAHAPVTLFQKQPK